MHETLEEYMKKEAWECRGRVLFKMSVPALSQYVFQWFLKDNNPRCSLSEQTPLELNIPIINRASCPRNPEHRKTFTDKYGILRCGEMNEYTLESSGFYVDAFSFEHIYQEHPYVSRQWQCNAVISDAGARVPFDYLLYKLSTQHNNNLTVFPFPVHILVGYTAVWLDSWQNNYSS